MEPEERGKLVTSIGDPGNKSKSDGTTKPETSLAAYKTEAAVTFRVTRSPGWRSRSDRPVPAFSMIHGRCQHW